MSLNNPSKLIYTDQSRFYVFLHAGKLKIFQLNIAYKRGYNKGFYHLSFLYALYFHVVFNACLEFLQGRSVEIQKFNELSYDISFFLRKNQWAA